MNYDSIQLYRGFDIGSAKPTVQQRAGVTHHLLDVIEAGDEFNAADYARQAGVAIDGITSRNRTPLLVGGTGFYLRSLLSGLPPMPAANAAIRQRIRSIMARRTGRARLYRLLARVDPVSANRLSEADTHRIERALEIYMISGQPISSWSPPRPSSTLRYRTCRFAFQLPRSLLLERLDRRVDQMYEAGLIEETALLAQAYATNGRPFEAIGYREALMVIRGQIGLPEAISETKRRTRSYAKRQITWLRSEQDLQWIDLTHGTEAALHEMLTIWRSGC